MPPTQFKKKNILNVYLEVQPPDVVSQLILICVLKHPCYLMNGINLEN